MRPRRRTSGLGPFDQLSWRPKQTDQHPARTERTSRALAEELSQREGQIGRDLRIEPRAASSGDGGVVLFFGSCVFHLYGGNNGRDRAPYLAGMLAGYHSSLAICLRPEPYLGARRATSPRLLTGVGARYRLTHPMD